MQKRFGQDVEFMVVYVREAHAVDSVWPMAGGQHPVVEEPHTLEERRAIATTCLAKLALDPIPALVDGLDDAVDRAYEAWPDRLVLVDRAGRIAFRSAPGPFGFKPEELEAAIVRELTAR